MPLNQEQSFRRLLLSLTFAVILTFLVRILNIPSGYILPLSQFFSTVFLNSLSMIVLPLIVFSVMSGSAKFMQESSVTVPPLSIIRIFGCHTLVAAVIGAIAFNITQIVLPINPASKFVLLKAPQPYPVSDIFLKIFPPNIFAALNDQNMLGIISFSLFFGSSLGHLSRHKNPAITTLIQIIDAVTQVCLSLVKFFVSFLPYAVLFFVLNLGLTFNINHLYHFTSYLMTFFLAVGLYWAVGLMTLRVILKESPLRSLRALKMPLVTAATTSSSAAALPDLMMVFEKNYHLPESFVRFTTPLGTILNMGASAFFLSASVLHLADLYGYPMLFWDQVGLVFLSWVTSWGIAGVPSGSLLSLMMLLSTLGIPKEALAMILGFDRVFDLFRTLSNVFGNAVSILYLARPMRKKISSASKRFSII
jgi:Na+/H+-dicarboxylate symporter